MKLLFHLSFQESQSCKVEIGKLAVPFFASWWKYESIKRVVVGFRAVDGVVVLFPVVRSVIVQEQQL
jgi:hypothetical protein